MLFASSRAPSRSFRSPMPASRCARSSTAVAIAAVRSGKSFSRKRIHHFFELTGACIVMASFLVLALFV